MINNDEEKEGRSWIPNVDRVVLPWHEVYDIDPSQDSRVKFRKRKMVYTFRLLPCHLKTGSPKMKVLGPRGA